MKYSKTSKYKIKTREKNNTDIKNYLEIAHQSKKKNSTEA